MTIKEFCYEWFNSAGRDEWDDITLGDIRRDMEESDNPECKRYSADDVFEAIQDVIREYDDLHKPDQDF